MVLPRVGVGGLLHGAYNYTGCYPRQVVFRRRSIRATGSEPTVFPDRLPRGQQVITSHLLFRIIPQHVAVFQPRIDPLCRERQISYQSEFWAGSVLGGWLRASSASFSPVPIAEATVRRCVDAGRPQLWPSSVWPISAVFGRYAKVTFQLHLRAAENGRNRPRLAIRAVTIFRGRALSQSATVNRARMVPRLLATSETPQTRDRGLKTLGVVRYETPRIEHVRSRVSTSLIGA